MAQRGRCRSLFVFPERCGLLGLMLWVSSGAPGCAKPTDAGPVPSISLQASTPQPSPILVDGSSTVGPISDAVLALYASKLVTDVKLATSGTGGGFKKFCTGKTAINGASRPIAPTEEKLCQEHQVEFIELPIAYDGIAVVVHKQNDWANSLTVSELRKLWEPAAQGVIKRWSDVRRGWPNEEIHLAGPGLDSGTFDFFTEVIVGEAHASRADYKASEDDEELVNHVAGDKNGLAYFGLAHVAKNADRLRALGIDDENGENGAGPILPEKQEVADNRYHPLSRPLFLYVSTRELERPEVQEFVSFYLRAARLVAPDVGYVPLPKRAFTLASDRLRARRTGSVFQGLRGVVGLTIHELMEAETLTVKADAVTP